MRFKEWYDANCGVGSIPASKAAQYELLYKCWCAAGGGSDDAQNVQDPAPAPTPPPAEDDA